MRHAVVVGSRHLTYLEAGASDGATLVLLHAFPLTADMWRDQLAAPPPGWRLLAPDFAGFGGSDDHEREDVSLNDYASDVIAWLDRLGVGQVTVTGESMGGYVALALARLSPQRLRGLVLADTRATPDTPDARAGRDRMLEILSERGPDGVADEMLPKLLGPTTHRTRPDLVSEVRSLVLSSAPEGIRRGLLRLRDRPDATPVLRRIRVPALVLVGREDQVTPLEEAQALKDGIPLSTLEILEDAGHLSNVEAPAAFNASLERFLRTL